MNKIQMQIRYTKLQGNRPYQWSEDDLDFMIKYIQICIDDLRQKIGNPGLSEGDASRVREKLDCKTRERIKFKRELNRRNKRSINMSEKKEWTVLDFGKHKGKTFPQVMFTDPNWFFWAHENQIFKDRGRLRIEANEVFHKSTKIKIPQKEGEETLVAEYGIHPLSNNSVGFELVEQSRQPHQGSTKVFRRSVIDLSIPRQIEGYDKMGYKIFIANIKYYLFGDTKTKMTKKKCEEYYSTGSNFEL